MIDNVGLLIDSFSKSRMVDYDTMEEIIDMSREDLLCAMSSYFHGDSVEEMVEHGYSTNKIVQIISNRLKISKAAKREIRRTNSNKRSGFNATNLYTLLKNLTEAKKIPNNVLINVFNIPQEEFMYIFKAYFERKSAPKEATISDNANIHAISRINSETIHQVMNQDPYTSGYVKLKLYEDYRERSISRSNNIKK